MAVIRAQGGHTPIKQDSLVCSMKNEGNIQIQLIHIHPEFLINDPKGILCAVVHERRSKISCNNIVKIRK